MDNCLPPSALPGEDLAELSPPGLVVGSGAPTGLSSLGVSGVPWHHQILTDQLTYLNPGWADYAHHITTGTPGFSDLPTVVTHYRMHSLTR